MSKAQMFNISYTVWKAIVQANSFSVYFYEDDGVTGQGTAFAGTDVHIYTARIVDDTWDDFDLNFPSSTRIIVGRKDDAIANIIGFSSVPRLSRTKDGKPVYSSWPTEGSRKTVITSNWADKTTWHFDSTHVRDEVFSTTVSGSAYQLANSAIIDATHGKITGEGALLHSAGMSFNVTVSGTVSGTTNNYTEVDPHTGLGDFTLNYETGALVFSPPVADDVVVMGTYHIPLSSEFIFGPSPGKTLSIKDVEVQFSADLEITDTVFFEAYGYVDVFAPQYLTTNGGPYPPGTKIPLGKTTYKTMMDYVNEANGALPRITKLGGSGWRGMPDDVIIFPWNYQAMTTLSSAAGMEIRIRLEHDTPFNGSIATVTFYCLSEDE